ncbi:hypothetical protein IQ260_28205 [Leptolyngbya cf. ectocarpi LEGE 11479]|uniref:Uncharacterized protein n=1 Tax=Leptolyngbya cf. ectocarpi LEGE 11479 TaxID=1828722 RepID=A0A928ZZS9_LEPEC|nr:hypothetical protein [Leptolyngbya ectocarpi]MBE9070532.1 hypothetical protein [Leptolyngbya cf. ectocarpi LEGE 11479]
MERAQAQLTVQEVIASTADAQGTVNLYHSNNPVSTSVNSDVSLRFERFDCIETVTDNSFVKLLYRPERISPERTLVSLKSNSRLLYDKYLAIAEVDDDDNEGVRNRIEISLGCNGSPQSTAVVIDQLAHVETLVDTRFARAQVGNLSPIANSNQNFSASGGVLIAQQSANSVRFFNPVNYQVTVISPNGTTILLGAGQVVTANSQGLGQPQTFDLQHFLNTGSLTTALIPGNNAAIDGLSADVQEIYRKAWPDIQATLDAQARQIDSGNSDRDSIGDNSIGEVINIREDIVDSIF